MFVFKELAINYVEEAGAILIDDYRFGCMVVDGKQYTSDLIIFPDRVFSGWWRKEVHQLCVDDITEILNEELDVLVVRTGYEGLMKILSEVEELLP
ncbi:MAG: MTH938/NDUFAF3 family protein [Candidatus Bathyarchaeota archaeon]|nr:MTH938/NDUFAF3 family protein [Candidatus Bathyarchaeota archaeon]